MRAGYVAVVLLVLSPSIAIALFTLIVLTREATFVRERSSPEALHHYTIRLAGVEIPFYPRVWASVVLLVGAVLWIIGLTVLFFLRR
jgi:hypothetical protein